MNEFGKRLRYHRRQCHDVDGRTLSQARLAERLAKVLGDNGYSPQTISNWERGKHQIHKDDRSVLVALIKVLHQCGGLKTREEADQLLLAGKYAPLNETVRKRIFPDALPEMEDNPADGDRNAQGTASTRERLSDWVTAALSDIEKGDGPPHWSGYLLVFLGWPSRRWQSEDVFKAILWIAIWLLTWWLTFPLMDWPFGDRAEAWHAALLYAAGTLIIPLFIGALTRTKDNPSWQEKGLANALTTRLYTHQGAFVGFHVGYAGVFALALLLYYFRLATVPVLLAGIAAALPVTLGYAAARQVPINLWSAYGRLHLRDGGIFFVFVLFGLLWAGFFFYFYPYLLMPITGIFIWLATGALLAGLTAWQFRRSGSSVIPVAVWVALYGSVAVLYLVAAGTSLVWILLFIAFLIVATVLVMRLMAWLALRIPRT